MIIHPAGSRPSATAPATYFTGTVRFDPLISAPAPARLNGVTVTFEPGARTHWHPHPLGQTLHVVSGVGRIQKLGEPAREILPGDTVWIAPGEKHWLGATDTSFMSHIAIAEILDGSLVDWMEHVTDEDYLRG